jgi:hypothetical protein
MTAEVPNVFGNRFDTPPFGEALDRFRQFIKSEGGSTDLFWVFREDVCTWGCTDWIRMPVPAENSKLAFAYYEFGRHRGLGVALSYLWNVDGQAACSVWVPKNQSEAADHLQPPCLKLRITQGPNGPFRIGVSVRSYFSWQYCRWRNRRCVGFNDDLPSRRDTARRMATDAVT